MIPERDDHGTYITPREIYMELRHISDAVIRLEGKLDQVDDLDSRLSAVEQRVWKASGGATVLGAALGYLVTLFGR